MSFKKRIEFANFTCKFGEELVLLDLFDEVILPSFLEMKYIRKSRDSEYFFIDTELQNVQFENGQNHLCIIGRFVKNTKLKREQVFSNDDGIVEDHEELDSAPSSLFVLILENHRLIYLREVSGAPTIETFQTTCSQFLRDQHKLYINTLSEENRKEREGDKAAKRLTKIELVKKYPYPLLRITPLTDKQSLKEFVDKFKVIDELVIKLLPTNDEDVDYDGFWSELNKRGEDMGSTKATIQFANRKDGLNEGMVYEQSKAATALANSELKLKGADHHGDTLKGNNEDFHLSIEVEDLSRNVSNAATILLSSFLNLVNTSVILAPRVSNSAINKVQDIARRLRQ